MGADSDLRRYRADANHLRGEIGKASTLVAAKRTKAANAAAAITKTKSASTIKSKEAEAEWATKEANSAEQKRADLEKKLADVEVKATRSQEKRDKERQSAQDRALLDLRRRADQAAAQFRSPDRSVPHRPVGVAVGLRPAYDVFLCHASEDKDEIARPLQQALETRRVSVWFDEIQIKVGDSIRQNIEAGIAACRFGVVVISPSFFAKQWTKAELDALFDKKMQSGKNNLLPIWHRVSKDEVMQHSALLAGILALNSAMMTVDEMADALASAIHGQEIPGLSARASLDLSWCEPRAALLSSPSRL